MLNKIGLDFGFIAEIQQNEQKQALQTVDHFDSASSEAAEMVLSIDDAAFNSEVARLRRDGLFAVFGLSTDIIDDELEDDELPSDRLDAYIQYGIAGEVDDTEDPENEQVLQHTMQIKAANMADAFASLGVSDSLIEEAFGEDTDDANDAIQEIAEIVESNTPKDKEEKQEFIEMFLFGDAGMDMSNGQVDEYDSAQVGKNTTRKTKFGQTVHYKGVKAIRQGKLTVVNKRIGNIKLKLSPKQKASLKKALRKAVSPNAIKKRMKSLMKGRRQNIYKNS